MAGNSTQEELQINSSYLELLQDVLDDLVGLNLIKERKITVGKNPSVKISLKVSTKDFYTWEIEVQSELEEHNNLLTIIKVVNDKLRELYRRRTDE